MADNRDRGLVSVGHGFEVADGDPDVRGWDVISADQRRIGKVDDLLADPNAQKVRYLTVDLDRDVRGGDMGDGTIEVPISRARIHERDHQVILDISSANITGLESAAPQPLRDDQVRMTRAAEELRVGTQRVQAGEVEVKKRVETERVREGVTLRGEEVDIERRPVSGRASTDDVRITGQEVRVPIMEEEAVIETRPVVKEELVISKRPTERTETVEADVREERIDVERHGDIRGRADEEGKRRG